MFCQIHVRFDKLFVSKLVKIVFCRYYHSWQRIPYLLVLCTPYFGSLYFLNLSTHPPPLSNLHSHCFFFVTLFRWLNGLLHHIWYVVLVNDIMDLHIFSLGIILPEGSFCVFKRTRCQNYWGLAQNLVLTWYHTRTKTLNKQRG